VLDRRENLFYVDLRAQLAQLLACELCTVVGDKTPWYAKADGILMELFLDVVKNGAEAMD